MTLTKTTQERKGSKAQGDLKSSPKIKRVNEMSNDLPKKTNWDDFSNTVSGSTGSLPDKTVDCPLLNCTDYFANHVV